MKEKHSLLDWIGGFIILGLIGYAFRNIAKLSEYLVSLISPESNKPLYIDLGIGAILLFTGMIFLLLYIKLKEDSLLQRIATAMLYLNIFAFVFYLFYFVIRIFN